MSTKRRPVDLINCVKIVAVHRMHVRLVKRELCMDDLALAVRVAMAHFLWAWQRHTNSTH